MNDPHVEFLRYHLDVAETRRFDNPPPLEQENAEFRIRLAEGVLTVWPKGQFFSEEDARGTVEPYLKSWEAFEAVRRFGQRDMRFEFKYARFIPPDVPLKGALTDEMVGTLKVSVPHEARYPKPPENFVASHEVEFMLGRYEQYLKGREPLLAMGFVCLTRLQHSARHEQGKHTLRSKAADKYRIDKDVLGTLGHLTSVLGDEADARKVDAKSENRPPTYRERRWIERCVLALISRAGELAGDKEKTLSKITMDNLPSLD